MHQFMMALAVAPVYNRRHFEGAASPLIEWHDSLVEPIPSEEIRP